MLDILDRRLTEHMERDERIIEGISEDIKDIKENHLRHIQTDVASLKANYEWVKWGVVVLIGGIIAVYFKT